MVNSPGVSTTVDIPMARTGSTSSRGPIKTSNTRLPVDEAVGSVRGSRCYGGSRASSCRSTAPSYRPEFTHRARSIVGQSAKRGHRHLFRGGFDYPSLGRDGLPADARQLERKLL